MKTHIFFQILIAFSAIAGRKHQHGHKHGHHLRHQNNNNNYNSHNWHNNHGNYNNHHHGHHNKPKQEHPSNGNVNNPDNGRLDDHLPVPDAEDTKACDVEYMLLEESVTETQRCRDGKKFFYTDRYKNETFCSNSVTVEDGECW